MRKIIWFLIILNSSFVAKSNIDTPVKINWSNLKDVKFKRKFNDEINQYLLYPTFGESIKKLQGKKVEIKGYVIPISQEFYVLSAFPMASCFFCGGSGPESIIQLNFNKTKRYRTDQIITVVGILKLNAENIEDLNYILEEVSEIEK
jgi:hypothetical protein